MPNLKELKVRINSVKSTQKITSAMKLVAASKLKHAQKAAEAARPYIKRMDRMFAVVRSSLSNDYAPKLLIGNGREEVHLVVVFTADHGLCGGFNSSITRAARCKIDALVAKGNTVKVLTIGRKGHEQLCRTHGDKIISFNENLASPVSNFKLAENICHELIRRYEEDDFDVATLFFNKFHSVITQIVTEQKIIPISLSDCNNQKEINSLKAIYKFEMNEESIMSAIFPRNLTAQIFNCLLENTTSEYGARMTAMDEAASNAEDMLSKLTLKYNRTRQTYITNELIEIISGAEAL
ncbi:ATP synthase F1, gamma subunit [Candidatus Endolissoclinum faulkneri L2]|uniref:ATP synthase gamma chain n=1 Tax=Candidatus Endolissoclinum faulkneri L2 TaxID=1193729 RepID=K7Z4C3_9PROT|nr:F0F1 ATP synthase subunit gamma [Candidatus Endolissoclinum faulkneri]AFX98863.1 ATP synthase F1, gamma subunit [Candidatus Endolissoclinum faulkneri L2]